MLPLKLGDRSTILAYSPVPSSPGSPHVPLLRRRSTATTSPTASPIPPLLPQSPTFTRPRRRKLLALIARLTVGGIALLTLAYTVTRRPRRQAFPKTATAALNVTFSEYLEAHFPLDRTEAETPHIWITLADKEFTATGAANLHDFFEQLNVERKAYYREVGRQVRDSAIITLCLDGGCAEECEKRGMYCYEGFESRRPEMIRPATWPKLASLMEGLPNRDLFFIDADVGFKQDPYPYLEPLMVHYDVLAQENLVFNHLNTGFLWMRKGPLMAQAWQQVLEMDLVADSRDQVNLNLVLETGMRRLARGATEGDGHPLETDFVASNGLSIHILDQRLFRIMHLMEESPIFERHDSLIHHMTCADDKWVKIYIAKSQGYWSDVDHYYTRPPRLVSLEHLAGTGDAINQLFKVVVAAAHYTGRAIVPPTFVTVTDVPDTPSFARHSPSAFPLAHLGRAFNLSVLEPEYVEHSQAHLLGQSALNPRRTRDDPAWNAVSKRERKRRTDAAVSLARISEVDLRNYRTFYSLVQRLRRSDLADAPQIRFVNADRAEWWSTWNFDRLPVRHLRMCERLEEPWRCDEFCRGVDELKQGPLEEDWLEIKDIDW